MSTSADTPRPPFWKLLPPSPTPDDELCRCTSTPPLKLMCALAYNPLHCLHCNLETRLETLGLNEELSEKLAFWRTVYAAIDDLWLDSKEYEAWAERELSNIESPVNKRGRALIGEVSEIRKCYYWCFQGRKAPTSCPLCHRILTEYKKGPFADSFPQRVCEHCCLVAAVEDCPA